MTTKVLTLTLALLMTAIALPNGVQAEECLEGEACIEETGCGEEACSDHAPQAYGEADCIECSGPAPTGDDDGIMYAYSEMDCPECDTPLMQDDATRGPEGCENCRDLETTADGTGSEEENAATLGLIAMIGALGAVVWMRRR